mgnify:CR=1 FL=1
MKNILFTLAFLISFSSFGQLSNKDLEDLDKIINDYISQFDKCSPDFMYSDNDLLEYFLNNPNPGESSYSNKKNLFFWETTTFSWGSVEKDYSKYTFYTSDSLSSNAWVYADEFIKRNNIKDEELLEIIDDIKGGLDGMSFSSKKRSYDISYDGCEIWDIKENYNRGRKKNHYILNYDVLAEIIELEYIKNNEKIIHFGYSMERYINDILVSETYFSENGAFTTTYSDGVIYNTDEFDEETQIYKWQSFYPNGNLRDSGSYHSPGGAYGNWEFYSNSGNYTANADLDDKYKIKDSAEIYKSGVFLKKVRLKNKRKGKLLDLLNELDSDN